MSPVQQCTSTLYTTVYTNIRRCMTTVYFTTNPRRPVYVRCMHLLEYTWFVYSSWDFSHFGGSNKTLHIPPLLQDTVAYNLLLPVFKSVQGTLESLVDLRSTTFSTVPCTDLKTCKIKLHVFCRPTPTFLSFSTLHIHQTSSSLPSLITNNLGSLLRSTLLYPTARCFYFYSSQVMTGGSFSHYDTHQSQSSSTPTTTQAISLPSPHRISLSIQRHATRTMDLPHRPSSTPPAPMCSKSSHHPYGTPPHPSSILFHNSNPPLSSCSGTYAFLRTPET